MEYTIITMIGKERHQDLQKCRQICQSWNVMMSQMTRYKKDTLRREAERLAAQIQAKWSYQERGLAHHGLLSSVEQMWLEDVDLTSVPAEHLSSLAACVTWRTYVDMNVDNCDFISLLHNVKCERLGIIGQSLSSEAQWS